MARYIFEEAGAKVPLDECPSGIFRADSGALGFRSDYGDDAYVLSSGEYWWGGVTDRTVRNAQSVQPLVLIRKEEVQP